MLLALLSDPNLSTEEIERIVTLRNQFQAVTEQVKELCSDHPERTVTLRLLEESLSCAVRCVLPEENPFFQDNLTKRGLYMKKNPGRWEKKMEDAGLSAPYQTTKGN
jgi:hypothetical protein